MYLFRKASFEEGGGSERMAGKNGVGVFEVTSAKANGRVRGMGMLEEEKT